MNGKGGAAAKMHYSKGRTCPSLLMIPKMRTEINRKERHSPDNGTPARRHAAPGIDLNQNKTDNI